MKPTHLALTSALVLAPMAGAAQETLSLYNWGDYINPEVLDAFTEETGIAVTLDTYGSNEEMLAKIQAGATGYDIVFPSVHMHDILFQLGLLAKTDIGQAPGFREFHKLIAKAITLGNRRTPGPFPAGIVTGIALEILPVRELAVRQGLQIAS